MYLNGEHSQTTMGLNESQTNINIICRISDDDDELNNQHQLDHLDCFGKKPLAMVRPRRIFRSSNNVNPFLSTIDLNYNLAGRLRECRSLDWIPNRLRNRFDMKRQQISKLIDQSTCSLDAGVAMINHDPIPFSLNCLQNNHFELDSNRMNIGIRRNDSNISAIVANTTKNSITNRNNSKLHYKPLNNNCNVTEEAQCPLLLRQNSLSRGPQDEMLSHQKRWRSLESIDNRHDAESISTSKKNTNRGSIRSWLYNLFQGHGFNDSSLRKVGVVQSHVKGFGDLPSAPEHESIV